MKDKNVKTMHKHLLALSVVFMTFTFAVPAFTQDQTGSAQGDSAYKQMSIDNLMEIRKYFNSKVKEIRSDEEKTRIRSMEWSESFLSEKGDKIAEKDKVYIRLAEYYIEEAELENQKAIAEYEETVDEKYDEYERLLTEYEQDSSKFDGPPQPPQFPQIDYSKAIAVYDRILNEYPGSEHADDALYSKAFLLEKMGQGAKSRRIFQEVIDKYPESHFAAESYMHLAEYYFNPREGKDEDQNVVELKRAIQLYKNVLKYPGSKRYDEALYKLGWSYYKLAARDPEYYDDAIVYFITVADDINKAQKLDPQKKISNFDVKQEAIEYIGISFTDKAYTQNGVDKARRTLKRIGDREYGPEIMMAIGNTYQRIDEQSEAIYAFRTLLDMYPEYPEAPQVQQNIVTALYAEKKDQEAYQARITLYENYGPKSVWYENLEDAQLPNKFQYLDKAYKLSEEAFRTNLFLDLQQAQDTEAAGQPSREEYQVFANSCKKYLDYFPADSNAYKVNWSYALMLHTKLNDFETAFDEYVRVSNDYLEEKYQHEAAINAVVVADTIVRIKFGALLESTKEFNLADAAQLSPDALTPEESMLVTAYDNYIRLFPAGKYTPNFLAQAGGIYYNHKKFAEAKVYFQTLVKRFPEAEQKSLAMRSIMDSYFALGKFKDSEIIAKRIMSEQSISEEQRQFAEKRLGMAIFKNAEYMEEQGDYFSAANEYFRVYEEAPNDQRLVEAALYNSGRNFELAKDWVRAIELFDLLATEYPNSNFALDALKKLANAYVELEQYANAGNAYERIYQNYPDTEDAESSLYNASFYYEKGEDWSNAIRVNNKYIQSYPDLSYAVDLFFKNAQLYLNLDNLAEANRIYAEFADRYPKDPRTVEAFYERGKYYLNNGQISAAKAELNKAIRQSEALRQQGQDPNEKIAGEAVYTLAEIIHDEYTSIKLKQPEANIEVQIARMNDLLRELNLAYTKVISFRSIRSFEATYGIALSYEEYAYIFVNQELDPNLNETRRFVVKKQINEQAANLYDRAVEQYKQTVEKLPVLAEKLEVDMFGTEESEPLATADTTMAAGTDVEERAAERDTTREVALKYYEMAKNKISELLYIEAALTTENVTYALNVENPADDPIVRAEYDKKVLAELVAPAIAKTIQAHIRNLNEAKPLGLSNKYVEESKRQILLTANILGEELEKMVYRSLDKYREATRAIEPLLSQEFGATNEQDQAYEDLDNLAKQMIDYARIWTVQALNAYTNSLNLAKTHNIVNDLLRNTEYRAIRAGVEIAQQMTTLADSARARSERFGAKFESTNNYNYDDASAYNEDYFYNFTSYSKQILEQAFAIRTEYDIENLWTQKLIVELIKLDPAKYTQEIPKDRLIIVSDDSWRYSTTYYPEQWVLSEFDDSDWNFAYIIPGDQGPFGDLDVNPNSIWVMPANLPATLPQDTTADTLAFARTDTLETAFTDTTNLIADTETTSIDSIIYFRKTVQFDGTPVAGKFYITADDDFHLYINGEYMINDSDTLNGFHNIDSVDFDYFQEFVSQGENVIAVDVEDKNLTGGGLRFYGYIDLLPADITASAEERAKVKKVVVDPLILRKVNILNKNRISNQNQ